MGTFLAHAEQSPFEQSSESQAIIANLRRDCDAQANVPLNQHECSVYTQEIKKMRAASAENRSKGYPDLANATDYCIKTFDIRYQRSCKTPQSPGVQHNNNNGATATGIGSKTKPAKDAHSGKLATDGSVSDDIFASMPADVDDDLFLDDQSGMKKRTTAKKKSEHAKKICSVEECAKLNEYYSQFLPQEESKYRLAIEDNESTIRLLQEQLDDVKNSSALNTPMVFAKIMIRVADIVGNTLSLVLPTLDVPDGDSAKLLYDSVKALKDLQYYFMAISESIRNKGSVENYKHVGKLIPKVRNVISIANHIKEIGVDGKLYSEDAASFKYQTGTLITLLKQEQNRLKASKDRLKINKTLQELISKCGCGTNRLP